MDKIEFSPDKWNNIHVISIKFRKSLVVIYGIIITYIYSSTILRIDKNQMEAINSLAKIFGQKVQEQTKPPKNLTPPPIVESNKYTMDPPIQDIPIIYQDI